MDIPPYAPASRSMRMASPFPTDKEFKLYSTAKQREVYESLAELFSVIVTLDKLEKAYLRDSISSEEYTPACLRLIAQYNTLLKNETLAGEFGDLDSFKQKYHMDHVRATSRLKIGVPATVEQAIDSSHITSPSSSSHGPNPLMSSSGQPSSSLSNAAGSVPPGALGSSHNISAKAVAEATGSFITTMDGLKLNFRAKDQLHPLLSDLMTSLNKVTTNDFEGRAKIVQWLITLNAMKANEELSDDQSRELLFDLDTAYKAFYTSLH